MNLLHISNDYSGSTVYKNLIRELDDIGNLQIVYTPVKSETRIGKNHVDLKIEGSKIIYSHILNKTTDRIFYKKKLKKVCSDIESKIDLSKIDFIHAHTWYSDGGVAYLLSKKYNIPYVIGVRNTDLNVHHKYLIHHRKFGLRILNQAEKIILIGEYQKLFFNTKVRLGSLNKDKMMVVPNGVDCFWIENSRPFLPKPPPLNKFKVLYVGTFIKRKKLSELQQAVIKLFSKKNIKCELHIVGGELSRNSIIFDNIQKYPDLFKYHGQIEEKERLMEIYKDTHLFAMPSQQETFGLVYVEALLQGLPLLYTENEGIDGFYEEKIGEKVRKSKVEEIEEGLMKLMENYDSYAIPTEKIIQNHNWKNIALVYQNLYSENKRKEES